MEIKVTLPGNYIIENGIARKVTEQEIREFKRTHLSSELVLVTEDKNLARWHKIFHRVDVGHYSIKNRNCYEFECPFCQHRQSECEKVCPNCHHSLNNPIEEKIIVIEE